MLSQYIIAYLPFVFSFIAYSFALKSQLRHYLVLFIWNISIITLNLAN